ncbi:MAG TPA: hypothetical protein VL728_02920 [Cyclobacteriaceae bacterium]|jgi:hypothetical protein|nr:hypothetical protein [Cyclobacteriaceae bacterium]
MRIRILGLAVFILTAVAGYSQPPGNPNGGKKPGSVPITGIEYLIGLGGLYGLKKLFDPKKKGKQQ